MAHTGTILFYHNHLPIYISLKRSHAFWAYKGTILYFTCLLHAHYMTHLFHLNSSNYTITINIYNIEICYTIISVLLLLTLQHGVISAAHHSKHFNCRGVTSTAHHTALSHSFNYISTTKKKTKLRGLSSRANYTDRTDNIGRKCNRAGLYVFKELALLWCRTQFLQIITSLFSLLSNLGFLFAISNFTGGFMGLWNEEMKYETNVIAIIT
jgi:hypothetical protein